MDETLPSFTQNDCTFHAETMGDADKPVIIALRCNKILDIFEGWRAIKKTTDETVTAFVHDPELLAQLDFISDAPKFDGRTPFLGSTCNTVYGAEYQKQHLPFYQDARLEIVEESGHFIFYDQPEVSLGFIRGFLTN